MEFEESNSKNQRNDGCLINCLPGDLIKRVFLRIPVSTLLRCVGVCKQWKTMIRDPEFAILHLQHAPRHAIFFFQRESVARKLYPSDAIIVDEAWSQSTYAVPVIGPDDLLCGSCNGLLCLYTNASTIKIANFATGESMCIEKPLRSLKGDHFSFYTFGFHPLKKEYKITHFLSDQVQGCLQNKDIFNTIQVYALGDEKWKDINTPEALSLNYVRMSRAINVDGIVYWLTEDMTASCQHAVMSFDTSEESFEDWAYSLREIDGKICVATLKKINGYPLKVLFGKSKIWALDNKVEQRWSLKYNIETSDYIPRPSLVYGGKLLMQQSDNTLFTNNLLWNGDNFETESSKMVKLLDSLSRKPENMQCYICVKSFVRLDIYKKVGILERQNKRDGWKLKKWKVWENKLSEREEMWIHVLRKKHEKAESAKRFVAWLNGLLPLIPDEAIRQQIDMKVNKIFRDIPDEHPRSLRRVNLMGQKKDIDNLVARMSKLVYNSKATSDAIRSILGIMKSTIPDKVGSFSSHDAIPSQYHSQAEDTFET